MKKPKDMADELLTGQPAIVRELWQEAQKHKRAKERKEFQARQQQKPK